MSFATLEELENEKWQLAWRYLLIKRLLFESHLHYLHK